MIERLCQFSQNKLALIRHFDNDNARPIAPVEFTPIRRGIEVTVTSQMTVTSLFHPFCESGLSFNIRVFAPAREVMPGKNATALR